MSSEEGDHKEDSDGEADQFSNVAKEREDRQHRKYCELFPQGAPNAPAWERLESGEIACHVSQLLFTTAMQCINHRQKKKYRMALATTGVKEDPSLMSDLEAQAHEEKDKLHQHKHDLVKQRNAAKQTLKVEVSRLNKVNRQLEHELRQARRRMDRMQAQQEKQLEHLRTMHQQQLSKLSRLLEERTCPTCSASNETARLHITGALQQLQKEEQSAGATLQTGVSASSSSGSNQCSPDTEGSKDVWASVPFDEMAGLVGDVRSLTGLLMNPGDDLYGAIPPEVMDAWCSLCIP